MEVNVKDETAIVSGKRGKDLTTKLMVKSGDTIVIGGIYTETVTDNESGIPYLRQIPFLGWLFKAEIKDTKKVELLMFLRPTVLPPPRQAEL